MIRTWWNIQFVRDILNNLFPRTERKWEIMIRIFMYLYVCIYLCVYVFIFFSSSHIDRAIIICPKKMKSKIIKSALYVIARLCKLTGKI